MRGFFPIRCAQGQNDGIAQGTPIQNLPWAEVGGRIKYCCRRSRNGGIGWNGCYETDQPCSRMVGEADSTNRRNKNDYREYQ